MATKPTGVGIMLAIKPKSGPPDLPGPGEPDADDRGGPSDDQDDRSGGVEPEWVDYHTGDETCQHCSYMSDGGTCDVLKMNVGPNDHCEAFEAKQEQGDETGGGAPEQAPDQPSGGDYGPQQ